MRLWHVAVVSGLACALLPGLSPAAEVKRKGSIELSQAWARSKPGDAKTATAYVKISNLGEDADRFESAVTPVAERVELKDSGTLGGGVRIRDDGGMEVPPGTTTEMKPGSLHFVLSSVNQPLRVGAQFPIVLFFEKAGPIRIDVDVREPAL